MTAIQRSIARRPAGVSALVAAALTVLALALAAQASAAPTTVDVNATTGSDTNPGTAAQPLKTLGRGLKLAGAGTTIKLAAGLYGPGFSGDQFPASGLAVPSGVTIDGGGPDGSLGATLLGPGSGVGLNLTGDATVRNLVWGGAGFAVGVFAKQGTHTLSNVFVPAIGKLAFVDGSPALGGIALYGTARATLLSGAGANSPGSTIFVNAGTGINVRDQAQLTMQGGRIEANQFRGVLVEQTARFTLDGGTIVGAAGTSCPSGTGIGVDDAAQATLKNQAALTNLQTALTTRGEPTATLTGVRITKAYHPGCPEAASVNARSGSASLTFDRTALTTTGGQTEFDVGMSTAGKAAVTLKQAKITGNAGAGLELDGTGKTTLDTSQLNNNKIGIDTTGVAGSLAQLRITGSLLTRNDIAVLIRNAHFKLRSSRVILNRIGIRMENSFTAAINAQLDACVAPFACANLGTAAIPGFAAADPGNNDLSRNIETAVSFNGGGAQAVVAIGNVWNPNTQGANSSGIYPQNVVVEAAPGGGPNGTNFRLAGGRFSQIELGPAPAVGTFKLSPRTLIAKAGRRASWKLAWTHPTSWRKLRTVQLRLYRGGKPVGTITARPRNSRLSARGAITLVAGQSRLTHRGKTVTARLTVRLPRSLAGTRLRVAVRATDRRGHRQLEPTAGRIKVAR